MDAFQIAMQDIFFYIPGEVLNAIFNPVANQMTIDECIKQKIILGKIMSDLNLVGGKLHQILLKAENAIYCPPPAPYSILANGNYSLYRIPPEDREHRNIAAVIGIKYPYNLTYYNGIPSSFWPYSGGTQLDNLASATINSQTFATNITTPTPYIKQGNIIQLDPPQMSHIDWVLECRLEWDGNFTSMENSAIKVFSDLVYMATRIYIYTQASIQADRIFLSGGQELNSIKEFIAEGKDYIERYKEKLDEFLGAVLISRQDMKEMLSYML